MIWSTEIVVFLHKILAESSPSMPCVFIKGLNMYHVCK